MGLTLDLNDILRKLTESGRVQMKIGEDVLVSAQWKAGTVNAGVPTIQISVVGIQPGGEAEENQPPKEPA